MKVRQHRGGARGFTLVELSTVVVLVSVLATVATLGYLRHIRHARMAEATQMVNSIRTAEESYKQEKGVYFQASNDQTSYYPAATPGAFKTQWGGPCGNCVSQDAWQTLGVQPAAPVMFGYSAFADIGSSIRPMIPPSVAPTPPPAPTSCSTIAPNDPFYIIQAEGDVDGDGVSGNVLAVSCSNTFIITNEGE